MSKIGVGIIGTGFGQTIHIPALQIHPDTEVVAVYHRDRSKPNKLLLNSTFPMLAIALKIYLPLSLCKQ